jgi:hypothetical protein
MTPEQERLAAESEMVVREVVKKFVPVHLPAVELAEREV